MASSSASDRVAKSLLIYLPTMPEESGAAALAKMILGDQIDCQACQIRDDLGKLDVSSSPVIYVLGSYWRTQLTGEVEDLAASLQGLDIVVYVNDTKAPSGRGFVTIHSEFQDPIEFVQQVVIGEERLSSPLTMAFLTRHAPLLKLTADKFVGKRDAQNHPVFTGMYQIANYMYDAYLAIFSEKADFDKCSEEGRVIMASQFGMAINRARKNSRLIRRGDITIAVTNAPELIDMTHSALREHYHGDEPTVTMTVNIDFTGETDGLKVSYRSYGGYDVGSHASKVGGGGTETRGGAGILTPDLLKPLIPE